MTPLIALQVALPLFAAPITALIPKKSAAWAFTFGIAIITAVIALLLVFTVAKQGALSYAMGNWAPPVGIEYRADALSAAILALISLTAVFVLPSAMPKYLHDIAPEKLPLFYAMFLLCLTGLLGMAITNDIFNIYVFLEISSLATYALIACGKDKRASVAAFEYLILGTIGATFFLIGIGLLYMATGTLNLSDLATLLKPLGDNTLVRAGAAFILLGLCLKMALFPLHMWLVHAYEYAPSAISAFLSATATKVALYLLARLIFGVFGTAWIFDTLPVAPLLQLLAAGAIIIGSVTAIFQKNIKRMLAFSSIAQIGCILLGFSLDTAAGFSAALMYLLLHALAKAGLFLATGCVEYQRGGVTLAHFSGMGKRMPYTVAAFALCGVSLIGIPLTAGFLSKWMLLNALLVAGQWPLLILMLISSLATVIYIWKVMEAAFFGKESELPMPGNIAPHKGEPPLPLLAPAALLAICCLWFGMVSEWPITLVQAATAIYFKAGS